MGNHADKEHSHGRLLARIVRTLLASEDFDALADLTDALKGRCAQLRISWTPDDITDAYRLVASNTPLTRVEAHRRRRMAHRQAVLEQRIDRADAAAILNRLGIYL